MVAKGSARPASSGHDRCHLTKKGDDWVLAIDGADRLALPANDGAGPYLVPTLRDEPPRADH